MLTRYFIGVSAKSKGFFTGFRHRYYYGDSKMEEAKPSFTKQSALADSFETEADAKAKLKQYRDEAVKERDVLQKKYNDYDKRRFEWSTLSDQKKINFLDANNVRVEYQPPNYSYKSWLTTSSGYGGGARKSSDMGKEELKAVRDVDWGKQLEVVQSAIDHYQSKIDFLDNKAVIREQEMEFKFMDKERREVKWTVRGADDTATDYCNCCGGAIPDVPQLVIGKYWNARCVICAICMGKLAEEAKVQAGKVSEEILEHYQTDRFLRSMD
jgi:hypothetical protein